MMETTATAIKIKVTPEGRVSIWIPEKDSLKKFIKARKLKTIHNFIPSGPMMIGADHGVKSVLSDIDRAERLAVFTDKSNMGHALALIYKESLECYDIGEVHESDLEVAHESN
jgi:hypothetical protein